MDKSVFHCVDLHFFSKSFVVSLQMPLSSFLHNFNLSLINLPHFPHYLIYCIGFLSLCFPQTKCTDWKKKITALDFELCCRDALNHQVANRTVVQRDGTLSLSDLQRDDGGLYTCTATNRHGHDSALYHLNVLGEL